MTGAAAIQIQGRSPANTVEAGLSVSSEALLKLADENIASIDKQLHL